MKFRDIDLDELASYSEGTEVFIGEHKDRYVVKPIDNFTRNELRIIVLDHRGYEQNIYLDQPLPFKIYAKISNAIRFIKD